MALTPERREYLREYRQRNLERVRAKERLRYLENRLLRLGYQREWVQKNREKRAAINRRWHLKNKARRYAAQKARRAERKKPRKKRAPKPKRTREHINAVKRAYYARNREKHAAATRRWYQKNREKLKAYYRERREKHGEAMRARTREWYQKNRERIAEQQRLRRGSCPRARASYEMQLAKARARRRALKAKVYTRENPDLETLHEYSFLNDYYRPAPGGYAGVDYVKARLVDELLTGKKPERPATPKVAVVIRRAKVNV